MTAFTFRQIKNFYLQGYKVESSIVHGYLDNGNNPNYQDRALSTPALIYTKSAQSIALLRRCITLR